MSEEIRERLVKHIQLYTYEFDPRGNYRYEHGDGKTEGSGEPSYEFEQSYRWKGIKVSLGQVSNELYNAWESMTIDRSTGRHWDNGQDFRKQLADAMNVNGVFAHKKRKAYWDLFVEELDKTFDARFVSALKRAGLNIS